MSWQFNSGVTAAFLATIAGARYYMKVWRDKTITHVFIRDMATNHLPHIYTALELIGENLKVDIAKSPRIRFLDEKDFEGK